jgi:hypothetical protein
MMKQFALAAAAAALLAIPPASAADTLKCDEDSMMKVEMMIKEGMDKPEMKKQAEMAMKENEMAAMSKKEGKTDECAMHLNMAQEEMMKKG